MMQEKRADLEEFAESCGYLDARTLADGRTIAVMPLMFTKAIVVFRDTTSIDDRWCYHDVASARYGIEEWSSRGYEGEPTGWHRHPYSGRRREGGDPAQEIVAP